MEWLTHSQTGFQQTARYLLGMRLTIVALQLISIAVAETMVTLAHRAEAVILLMAYGVLATLAWLWFTRRPPRSTRVVSLVLIVDLLMIGAWLYLTGGYTNPLVSLLLLPIAVAIVLVPMGQSIAVTVAGVAVYTSLVIWHTPVTHEHHSANLAQLHLVGMWVTFATTAAILLLVVGALARRLRQQQAQLAQIRETRLRDEQIIALGLSAAAVAHRLGTPLNTMTLLVEEMKSSVPGGAPMADDLALMESQLGLCSAHLQQLSRAAVEAKTAQLETLPARDWVHSPLAGCPHSMATAGTGRPGCRGRHPRSGRAQCVGQRGDSQPVLGRRVRPGKCRRPDGTGCRGPRRRSGIHPGRYARGEGGQFRERAGSWPFPLQRYHPASWR